MKKRFLKGALGLAMSVAAVFYQPAAVQAGVSCFPYTVSTNGSIGQYSYTFSLTAESLVRLSGYTTCNGSSSITLTGYYIGSTFTGIQNGGSYAGGPNGGGTSYDISGLSGYNVFVRAESTHNVPGYSGNLSIQIVDP